MRLRLVVLFLVWSAGMVFIGWFSNDLWSDRAVQVQHWKASYEFVYRDYYKMVKEENERRNPALAKPIDGQATIPKDSVARPVHQLKLFEEGWIDRESLVVDKDYRVWVNRDACVYSADHKPGWNWARVIWCRDGDGGQALNVLVHTDYQFRMSRAELRKDEWLPVRWVKRVQD